MDKRPFSLLRQGFFGSHKSVGTPETALSGFGDNIAKAPAPVDNWTLFPELPTALFEHPVTGAHRRPCGPLLNCSAFALPPLPGSFLRNACVTRRHSGSGLSSSIAPF